LRWLWASVIEVALNNKMTAIKAFLAIMAKFSGMSLSGQCTHTGRVPFG
jgi:hypothetical protein